MGEDDCELGRPQLIVVMGLVAFAATFEADAKAADVAVQARRDADTNNRHFREVGGLAHYLERNWASSFLPGRAPALLTEAQRLAKQEALERARKERAEMKEAQRVAREKVKAAKRELAALGKGR